MQENLEAGTENGAYPVSLKDVLASSGLDLIRRIDRVAMALCLVAITGAGVQKLIESDVHTVVVLFGAGFAGTLLMYACIAIMVGKARFLKPGRGTVSTVMAILLGTAVSGGFFGAVMSLVWFLLPDEAALLPGFYFGPAWMAWHVLGLAAMMSSVLSLVITIGWPLAVAYDRPYVTIIDEMEKYGDPDTLYDSKKWLGHIIFLMIVAATVPALCLLVPVWYAITVSRLCEKVWNKRELATATKQWPVPKKTL